MSAEKLRRAANALRDLAGAVEDVYGGGDSAWGIAQSWSTYYGRDDGYGPAASPTEGEYIALLHPGVGLALADLLESLAFDREANGEIDGRTWDRDIVPLADLILGGAS